MNSLVCILIMALIIWNFPHQETNDVVQIALNYLISRFGSANYEIISISEWNSQYLVIASEGKYYYNMIIDMNRKEIKSFEAREINMNFTLQIQNGTILIDCLNNNKGGFGLEIEKATKIKLTYYWENYKIDEDLKLALENLSLVEYESFTNKVLEEISLHQFSPQMNINMLRLSNNQIVAINADLKYDLSNSTKIDILISVAPSSLLLANLTGSYKIKSYAIYFYFNVLNYNIKHENAALGLKIDFDKNFVSQENGRKIFYNDKWIELMIENSKIIYAKNNEILIKLNTENENAFNTFKISYIVLRQFTSILYDYSTIILSIIILAFVTYLILIRNKKIKKELG
ncbi:MAG: hypothetical protein RQ952_02605 [Thermoproteota archaeon]|nr:hypothetical protein [Thermoproteota archaeon]